MIDSLDDPEVPEDQLRRSLAAQRRISPAPSAERGRLIEAADLVGDLWSVPAYLRRCAPWLDRDDVRALQRTEPQAWTVAIFRCWTPPGSGWAIPRTCDATVVARRSLAQERDYRYQVTDSIMENLDGYAEDVIMLRGADLQDALIDQRRACRRRARPAGRSVRSRDRRRSPGADRRRMADAAASLPVAELHHRRRSGAGPARIHRVVVRAARARSVIDRVAHARLTVNYRTPEEVMAEAEPMIRAAIPDANVPTSVRRGGCPVLRGTTSDLGAILDGWVAEHAEGTACVIGDPTVAGAGRVRSLSPKPGQGARVRPGRPRRPGSVRRRDRGRRRPVRGHDPGDSAAGDPQLKVHGCCLTGYLVLAAGDLMTTGLNSNANQAPSSTRAAVLQRDQGDRPGSSEQLGDRHRLARAVRQRPSPGP